MTHSWKEVVVKFDVFLTAKILSRKTEIAVIG